MNKVFHYGGLALSTFGSIQLLAFLGEAFPTWTPLSTLLLGSLFFVLFIMGLYNWVQLKMTGYSKNDHWIVGFFPALVCLPFVLGAMYGGFFLARNSLAFTLF